MFRQAMVTIRMIATITRAPTPSTTGETGKRRAGAASSSPRSTKARKPAVFALGSWSTSDMATTLAGQDAPMSGFSMIGSPLRHQPAGPRVPVHQPGEHDHAPGPDHERLGPDPLHHVLEVPDVGGPDVHQGVRLAGHRARGDHLGVAPHRGAD